jgi:hypothetical protein
VESVEVHDALGALGAHTTKVLSPALSDAVIVCKQARTAAVPTR